MTTYSARILFGPDEGKIHKDLSIDEATSLRDRLHQEGSIVYIFLQEEGRVDRAPTPTG